MINTCIRNFKIIDKINVCSPTNSVKKCDVPQYLSLKMVYL
ncbi:hypothetical protein [Escherichia coli ISC7]|uniref:Uncharacterized protein n=1 Tax=Escherichia coli ISC7 TaxID=1432555 RepID=W1F3B1_ECOLX|nr:hypothetical protein [Escherichia coli ISC7]